MKAYTILKILESLRLFRDVEEKSYVIPPKYFGQVLFVNSWMPLTIKAMCARYVQQIYLMIVIGCIWSFYMFIFVFVTWTFYYLYCIVLLMFYSTIRTCHRLGSNYFIFGYRLIQIGIKWRFIFIFCVYYAPQRAKHIVTVLSICPYICPVPCLPNNFKTTVGI